MSNWTAADIPSQEGRTAIVTGANSGIGYHAALALGRSGARTILACRDARRGEAALAHARRGAHADFELRLLDMASLDSIRAFAAAAPDRVDLLLNNAGVMAPPRGRGRTASSCSSGPTTSARSPSPVSCSARLTGGRPARGHDVLEHAQDGRAGLRRPAGSASTGAGSPTGTPSWPGCCSRSNCSGGRPRPARTCSAWPRIPATPRPSAQQGRANRRRDTAGEDHGLGVKLGAQSSADGAWPMLYAATAPGVPGGAFVGPSKRMETIGPPKLTQGQQAVARRGRRAPPVGGVRAAHERALRVRGARGELWSAHESSSRKPILSVVW